MVEQCQLIVSVILPVYNGANFLQKCIDSVLLQSYSSIELIIVDDGSTDGSSQICDYFSSSDSRVKVVHKQNGGVHSARNAGLQVATGELIMWVDSDDWIDVDWVERYVNVLKEKNVDIVIAGDKASNYKGSDILKQYLLDRLRRTMWVTCARASLYENLKFDNFAIGEDALFLCKLLNKAQSCCSIPQPMGYHYADNPDSVSRIASLSNKSDWPKRAMTELEFIYLVAPHLAKHAHYDIMRGAGTVYRSIRQLPTSISVEESNQRRFVLSKLRKIIFSSLIRLPYSEMDAHNYRQILVTFRDLTFK